MAYFMAFRLYSHISNPTCNLRGDFCKLVGHPSGNCETDERRRCGWRPRAAYCNKASSLPHCHHCCHVVFAFGVHGNEWTYSLMLSVMACIRVYEFTDHASFYPKSSLPQCPSHHKYATAMSFMSFAVVAVQFSSCQDRAAAAAP